MVRIHLEINIHGVYSSTHGVYLPLKSSLGGVPVAVLAVGGEGVDRNAELAEGVVRPVQT